MEIHMRGVSWSVDSYQLTRELANILHSPPYETLIPRMNFHVSLKRDKQYGRPHAGYGFLTLPTKEIGQKFLDEHSGPSKQLRLQGRVITFSKSHRDEGNAEILERIIRLPYIDPLQLKYDEDRASRLHAGAIALNAIQFGWDCRDDVFSIEWERRGHANLAFDPERNEIQISFLESSDIYYISLRYGQVRYIYVNPRQTVPSIYFNLFQAPSFERKNLFGGNSPRNRLPCFPFQDHARVAPYTSLALRLLCLKAEDIDTFRDLCVDAHMQGKLDSWEIRTESRGLFSAEIAEEYHIWLRDLPWEVAFQIEGIVRSMAVDPREILSLKDKIARLVDNHRSPYASQMLKDFRGRIVDYDEQEADIHKWFDNAADDYAAKVSKTPALEPTDGSLFQALHVTITPTTVTLDGPHPEQSNRVIRSYHPSTHSSFLRVNFVEEGGLSYRFDRDIDGADFVRNRVGTILFEGLTIAGRSFHFLAYSQSALKEHAVWFVKDFYDPAIGQVVTADAIIKSLGTFAGLKFDKKLIYCPARYAARISQAFTATDASVPVELEEIQFIDDIETNDRGYCFTDGVGKVSAALAEEIWSELKRTRKRARKSKAHPRAFQIRFQGSKGMLSIDHKLPGRVLCLRPSMIKFENAHSLTIDVARAFDRPTPYFLNRPLIMLLEGLGIPFDTFKKYQDLAIRQTQDAVQSTLTAARMLESYGLGTSYRISSVLLHLDKLGIGNLLSNPFWKKAMNFSQYHILRELKNHARIPVPGAWTLVGVADEHNYLDEGEIFACVKPQSGGTIYLTGDILISRSPTIHPGDVQVARAIGAPPPGSPLEKEPLPNTVVFSTKGKRPLPSCLGGGDLDGDVYNLLPLDEMPEFRPQSVEEPASYTPAKRKYLDRPSNMRDVAEFVLEFINSDMVGIIAINWLIIADQSPKCIFDESCLTLAQLHSDAVDYPKSGTPIELERIPKLKFKAKPDWIAPETINQGSGQFYPSQRALGKLFRGIELPPVSSAVDEGPSRRRRGREKRTRQHEQASKSGMPEDVIEEIEFLVDDYLGTHDLMNETSLSVVEQIYNRYVSELRTICATHSLSQSYSSRLSEEEVFIGTIVAKTSQPRKRKDLISRLREQTDVLIRGVKEELDGDDDTPLEEILERAWIAWGYAISKGAAFGAQSFSWIALHGIFEAVREIDTAVKKEARRRGY